MRRAACLLICALATAARADVLPSTGSLAIPNFNRTQIGPVESLEAGAYVARSVGPASNWYNPAGLADTDRTVISSSAIGYELSLLRLGNLEARIENTSALLPIPAFIGAVIGPPFINWQHLRLGFSLTKESSWSGGIDSANTLITGNQVERFAYTSDVEFSIVRPTVAVGFRPHRVIRVGASLAGVITTYSADTMLSDVATGGPTQVLLRTDRLKGHAVELQPSIGVQLSPPGEGWDFGAVLWAPGLRLFGTGALNYESVTTLGATTTTTSLEDNSARFAYQPPFEAVIGGAYTHRAGQIEVDLRYYTSSGTQPLFRSQQPIVHVSDTGGVQTTTTAPFDGINYETRPVLSGSVGGALQVSRLVALHGGFFLNRSPSRNTNTNFPQVNLYGGAAGGTLTTRHFVGSAGMTFSYGKSPDFGLAQGLPGTSVDVQVRLLTIAAIFAISYTF
ncbi:MAG: hypothetical protein JST54_30175 [Deltaproteobacteria bacterium]|nr:hypothetical protein [Deltaproteobacteria bacterium]